MPKKTSPIKYRKQVRIYSTLSGRKEIIKPIKDKKINLFVCGPTVYDFPHIGNARTYIIFDCFAKYLKSQGYRVFYLQNITDIDDKIIQRAREKGVGTRELAEAFLKEYLADMKALGVNSVTKYAKATSYIKEIKDQVKKLQAKGCAYRLDDGIYFDIKKFKEYGKLSGRTVLQAEDSVSRIDYSKDKKNRGDFCVWKFKTPGEPSWPASFGAGRPGWHIEDTAITEKFFGPQYDIHGGGRDIMFPHHEAEITQMESISGKKPLAKYWMHVGFLTVNGQKMGKSLNNFVFISEFLKRHSRQLLRFWVAKSLWRTPLDYSDSVMIEVKMSLEKIEEFLRKLKRVHDAKPVGKSLNLKKYQDDFYKNLADDFNTPKAIASLFDLIKQINKFLDKSLVKKQDAQKIYQFFKEINEIFNIIDFKKIKYPIVPGEVLELLEKREYYRKNREWEKADQVRKEIEKYRYFIEDTKEGPLLKRG